MLTSARFTPHAPERPFAAPLKKILAPLDYMARGLREEAARGEACKIEVYRLLGERVGLC
jgi:hypothetical protein